MNKILKFKKNHRIYWQNSRKINC